MVPRKNEEDHYLNTHAPVCEVPCYLLVFPGSIVWNVYEIHGLGTILCNWKLTRVENWKCFYFKNCQSHLVYFVSASCIDENTGSVL